MRPFRRPPVPADAAAYLIHDSLLDALGSYCTFCERRLSDECWGWNVQSRSLAGTHIQAGEWDQLFLLCYNCRDAALITQNTLSAVPLLLPDRAQTFSVTGPSPFSYHLQPVEVVFLAEDGTSLEAPETMERVIVRGASTEAQATIDYFALNTRYYDAAANTLRIPHSEYLSLVDRRVDLRTEAWRVATRQATRLKGADEPELRHALLVMTAQMIEGRGFWSTWATVLWQVLQDRATLADVLMPARSLAAPVASGKTGFYGQAHEFPATRPDWLD